MGKPLDECRATLARIDTKLDDFERSVGTYHLNSCRIVTDDDLQKGERLYRLKDVVQPPLDLSMDLTEITNLMRSVLDHLMFLLVEQANPGGLSPKQERQCQFPIAHIGKMAIAHDPILNLGNNIWGFLEALQLYSCTNPVERPLQILNAIVNISKHRFHTRIESIAPKAITAIEGIGGFTYTDHIGMHMTLGKHRIKSMHGLKTDFKEGAIIFRFVPENPVSTTVEPGHILSPEGFRGFYIDSSMSPAEREKYILRSLVFTKGQVDKDNTNPAVLPKAQAINGDTWTRADWDTYFSEVNVEIKITQQILFGPRSGIAENLPILDTLKTIRGYLHTDVFADRGVIAGM